MTSQNLVIFELWIPNTYCLRSLFCLFYNDSTWGCPDCFCTLSTHLMLTHCWMLVVMEFACAVTYIWMCVSVCVGQCVGVCLVKCCYVCKCMCVCLWLCGCVFVFVIVCVSVCFAGSLWRMGQLDFPLVGQYWDFFLKNIFFTYKVVFSCSSTYCQSQSL